MTIRLIICMWAVMLVAPSVVSGIYIWVPTDQPTIQAGIDAAIDGDTVMVLAGTYSGPGNRDIDFKGKKIWVYGFGGADQTIIDCGGTSTELHTGFIFQNNEDSTCLLTGFTIKNAWYPLQQDNSGAIIIKGSSAPVISFCTIAGNHANGIAVTGPSTVKFLRLQISSNDGWGIWMPMYPYLSVGVRIEECRIDHNLLGGAIVTRAVESTFVTRNTIVENGGHGLFLQGDLPARMQSVAWDTTTIIERNVFAFNAGKGIYAMGYFPGCQYHYNNLFGNKSGDGVGYSADTLCNITADPLFCRQASSQPYGLAANSACLAANNVCGVDMGAFGQECPSCCIGFRGNVDCDPSGNSDISDLSRLIDYLFISFTPLCCVEEANIDGTGSIDISDLSRLIDYLFINLYPPASCP
ncbi:MAG: right-handed parallel beta-helix repeat-containing protein [candidate division Zixibacteria bacterium]|nr:right-handed parallel beta-helix repeat-containing protein [candidate division Zixibacteria bacterium]